MLCHNAICSLDLIFGSKTLTLKCMAYISKTHTHTHLVCRRLVLVVLCLSGVRAACCSSVQWWMSVDLESALEKRVGVLSHPLQTLREQQEPAERLQSKELRSEQPMRDIKNNSSPALSRMSTSVFCFHRCVIWSCVFSSVFKWSFQWRTLCFKTLSECFKHQFTSDWLSSFICWYKRKAIFILECSSSEYSVLETSFWVRNGFHWLDGEKCPFHNGFKPEINASLESKG